MKRLLLALSSNQRFKRWCTQFPPTQRLARRFVAGERLSEAIRETQRLNEAGIAATLDHLGENVYTREEAAQAANVYLDILDQINIHKLDANVSLKPTQMGLALDGEICFENIKKIVEHAARYQNFVRIDMEGSQHTDCTIDIFKRLRGLGYQNVGPVFQSYLYRTGADIENLLPLGLNARLCKGAYAEPVSIAFAKKSDVDQNYLKLLELMLSEPALRHNSYVGIATHDERLIESALRLVRSKNISNQYFEFQMLYGIRTDLQKRLSEEGFRVRVYVSYGSEWYPYFMRRLAERPANLLFLLRNLFR